MQYYDRVIEYLSFRLASLRVKFHWMVVWSRLMRRFQAGLLAQPGDAADSAFVQALAAEHADLDLRLVQPAATTNHQSSLRTDPPAPCGYAWRDCPAPREWSRPRDSVRRSPSRKSANSGDERVGVAFAVPQRSYS
jgi:hypothetical protein